MDKRYIYKETIGDLHFEHTYHKGDLTKHSKNIIDLIEEGDIVNGCVVVAEKYTYIEMNFINIDSEISYGWGAGAIPENEIKTILTKEQYEQNSYKL